MGSTSARTELVKRVAAAAAVENAPNFMLMAIHKVSAVVEEVVELALLIEEQNVRPSCEGERDAHLPGLMARDVGIKAVPWHSPNDRQEVE
jgi:hypothetical protein